MEGSGKLKKSCPRILLGIFPPQSNSKTSCLLGLNHLNTTCGNFLASQAKKSQECNKKLIQRKSATNMPLQTITTNLFWPQGVFYLYMLINPLSKVQECIQLLTIDGHRYPRCIRDEAAMAAVQLQIMSTLRAVKFSNGTSSKFRALKEST